MDNVPSEVESKLEKLQGKYDELNDHMDDVLTETMDRSNRIVMESEVENLITSQVFNASNDGIWAINGHRKIIRVNRKLLRLFDKKIEQVIEGKCHEFFPGGCPLEKECPWESLEKGKPVVEQDRAVTFPSGEIRFFRVSFTPLADLEGSTIGLVETFSDITAIKRAEEALQRANRELEILASEDGLTRIANRRSFDGKIKLEWRRQRRAGKPVSLIMCDVDYFKRFNDTYGHQAGDRCLTKVASVIKKCIHRVSDVCARYGGEEFVILMPETDIKGARHVAERIRRGMERKRIPHEQSEAAPYVTLSFGIATVVPNDDSQPEELIESADRMLYRAKQLGRNRAIAEE